MGRRCSTTWWVSGGHVERMWRNIDMHGRAVFHLKPHEIINHQATQKGGQQNNDCGAVAELAITYGKGAIPIHLHQQT